MQPQKTCPKTCLHTVDDILGAIQNVYDFSLILKQVFFIFMFMLLQTCKTFSKDLLACYTERKSCIILVWNNTS